MIVGKKACRAEKFVKSALYKRHNSTIVPLCRKRIKEKKYPAACGERTNSVFYAKAEKNGF
jgi:hypothetical protein